MHTRILAYLVCIYLFTCIFTDTFFSLTLSFPLPCIAFICLGISTWVLGHHACHRMLRSCICVRLCTSTRGCIVRPTQLEQLEHVIAERLPSQEDKADGCGAISFCDVV